MPTQDTVNQIKMFALQSANIKTYSKSDVLCFGWLPELNLWRLMHQVDGIPMVVLEASKRDGEKLLDQAFTNIEVSGMRLLIVVDNKAMKY